MYVEADVENGKVVVDMTEDNANTRSAAMTRKIQPDYRPKGQEGTGILHRWMETSSR